MELNTKENEVINCKNFKEFEGVINYLKFKTSLNTPEASYKYVFNSITVGELCVNLTILPKIGIGELEYYKEKGFQSITTNEFFERNNVNK